jgi:glycine hydroxymethyltransferase
MGADETRRTIEDLVSRHEAWRATTLNLIASENVLSPTVLAALGTDLEGRYADYPGRDPSARRYRGNRDIAQIEVEATRLAQEVFGARYVELRAIAGHLAGLAIVLAVCRPGDLVLELDREGGGHREAGRLAIAPGISLNIGAVPFDAMRFNVDTAAAVALIEERRPRLVILGSSHFLFPHPVRAIAEVVHRIPDAVLAYDASHVLGFLAAHRFQDPLAEGADIVFGSTHKTFPGPQGGIIYSNDDALMSRVSEALVPGLVTNHHPARMPALALALAEMQAWGAAYMDQTVADARALGRALASRGLPVIEADGVPTDSHTLLVKTAGIAPGADLALRLEAAGIIVTHATLPDEHGREGLRLGTQEMTRRGATEPTMDRIADLIADVALRGRAPEAVASDVEALVGSFGPVRFTWPAT